MATPGDLPPRNGKRFTATVPLARSHRRLRASVSPKFFPVPATATPRPGHREVTQRCACRRAAKPKRDARTETPKVGLTVWSYRRPAAPLSSGTSRGPEVLRPCLTAGLPLSAFTRRGTSANLSHITDIIRRAQFELARNSRPISDVRTKSRHDLSDLCHMRCVRHRRRINGRTRQAAQKKEAGFPAPLTMTTKVHFVFFLVPQPQRARPLTAVLLHAA
jgi:hypothetical protein